MSSFIVTAMFVSELHFTQRCICKRVEVCTYDGRHRFSPSREALSVRNSEWCFQFCVEKVDYGKRKKCTIAEINHVFIHMIEYMKWCNVLSTKLIGLLSSVLLFLMINDHYRYTVTGMTSAYRCWGVRVSTKYIIIISFSSCICRGFDPWTKWLTQRSPKSAAVSCWVYIGNRFLRD